MVLSFITFQNNFFVTNIKDKYLAFFKPFCFFVSLAKMVTRTTRIVYKKSTQYKKFIWSWIVCQNLTLQEIFVQLHKTCSCLWYNILGHYFGIKNLLWFFSVFLRNLFWGKFKTEKVEWFHQKKIHGNLFFFWLSRKKKVNKFSWYHPKLTSQNIVHKEHEQVYRAQTLTPYHSSFVLNLSEVPRGAS